MMKFNPFLLIMTIFTLSIFNSFTVKGQKNIQQDPSVIKQLYDHDHKKCGSDEATDRLAQLNPEYAREVEEFKKHIIPAFAQPTQTLQAAPIIYVPVVVHVIHNGEAIGTGANISDERILAQIEVLNLDFSAMNSNFNDTPAQWQDDIGNPEVQFCMAIIDPDGNGTNGITRHNIAVTGTNSNDSNIESEIKPATWWDSDEYYNIYVVGIPGTNAGGGVTGYAYYPTNSMIGSNLDGSVVDYNWFGGPGFGQSGYSTLTHETGHYLGLPHPFDDEDCAADDNIDDTPNIDAPTSNYSPGLNCSPGNFPTGPISCTNEHMYVNFMDYVNDDDCSTSFTNDQISVMRSVLEGTPPPAPFNYGSRLPLTNNATTVCSFFDDDAGISAIINPTTSICGDGQITPTVTLQNFGENNLTTVTISYEINNGTSVDYIWIDNLATGETQDVSLSPFTPPAGDYTFTVYTNNPNGSTDEQTSNDQMEITVSTVVPTGIPLFENFEDAQWNPTVNGVFQFNISGDAFMWERSNSSSANGTGSGSAVFNNYDNIGGTNPGGTSDALITSVYDFSGVSGADLSFDVAYAPYDNTFFDSLKILASIDCGSTFTDLLFADGNTGLATAPATTGLFIPGSTQWENHTIDLSAYDNVPNLTIAFINQSGYGNQLFIDNIEISTGCSMTLQPEGTNPTCFNQCNGIATVSITDGVAPYFYQWDNNAGNSTDPLVQNLCAGLYTVTVTDNAGCSAIGVVELTDNPAMVLSTSSTNETSVGSEDGTATANVSGGNLPYTFQWDDVNNQTTMTATQLTAGVYCVTVTDNQGCTAESCTNVAGVDCTGFTVSVSKEDVSCFNAEDGTVNAVATNGTEPYSYLWNTTDESAELNDLGTGTYSVTATDAVGCTSEAFVIIDEPDPIIATVTCSDESSAGANDGSCTVMVDGGIAPYTAVWSPGGQSGTTINNLSAGTYQLTITDNNGCTAESSGTVNAGSCDLTTSLSVNNVSCFNLEDGNAEVSVTGGTEPITIAWETGESTNSIDGLAAGSYSVTVIDNLNCESVEQFVITEPNELSVSFNSMNPSSNGSNDGSITAMPNGGTPGYEYNWSNGETTPTISNLTAGVYVVTVTDMNECTTINEVQLEDPIVDCSSFTGELLTTDITCGGGNDGSAEVQISGGTQPYDYLWNNDGETTANINNLSAGQYTVTVMDANDCEIIVSGEVLSPDPLMVSLEGIAPSTPGASDGSISANPAGGTPSYSYMWNTTPMQTTQTIVLVPAGSYSVIVTDDNNCEAENVIVLEDPSVDCANFEVGFTSVIEITCNGFENGALVAMASNGELPYSYSWSNGVMTAVNAGLGADVYTVTATDLNGCTAVAEIELEEPPLLEVSTSSTPASSSTSMDGMATANPSGGTPGYTYEWSNGGITQTIIDLEVGTYIVTVTDNNGCVVSEEVVIGIDGVDCSNFSIVEFEVMNVNCFGGFDGSLSAITEGGTMPITYQWSNGGDTQIISGLQAGLYVVTATDANNCQTINEVELTQPDAGLDIDFTTTSESGPGNNDGAIDVTVNGGTPDYSYEWSNTEITEDINNLEAGTYELEVTDANGCTVSIMITVPGNGLDCGDFVLETEFENVSCNGAEDGLIVTTASGGISPITYNWSSGQMTQSIFDLSPGIYTVTVLDAQNCELIETFEITEPLPIILTVSSTDETMNGANDGTATAGATGGIPGYTYLWSNSEITSSISNLSPGNYSVTVTDNNGCTAVENVTIGAFSASCDTFDATITSTAVDCAGNNNGSATASADGGLPPYNYNWNNGSMSANNNNLSGGTYTVTVTDANDCIIVLSVEVDEPNELAVEVEGFGGTCGTGGTAVATVTGGTQAYSYMWSNGGTDNFISDLINGIYTVTITDVNGCSTVGETQVENTTGGIDIQYEVESVTCFGDSDGEIDITVIQGAPPYSFDWSNGETTEDIEDLEEGTYTVLITDVDGCSFISSFVVAAPAELMSNISWTPAGNDNSGTATANAFGGTTPYSYLWSNGSANPFIENLVPGNYSLTVTDANGCTSVSNTTIGVTAVNELPDLQSLDILPNPSNGNFVVNAAFSTFKEGDIEIYNIIGQKVYQQVFSAQDLRIDINVIDQPSGSYFLVVSTSEGRAVRKLVITK